MNWKRTYVSIIVGSFVMLFAWIYLNSYYSLTAEDVLYEKICFLKFKVFPQDPPKQINNIEFINTAKDLALVDDTSIMSYGQVVVADRIKLTQFLKSLRLFNISPTFVVIDLQFYYPYSSRSSKSTDDSSKVHVDAEFQNEISLLKKVTTPILLDNAGDTLSPIIHSFYPSLAEYKTFGDNVNKVRIKYSEKKMSSTALCLYNQVDNESFDDHNWYGTSNGNLCLTSIWPNYYLNDADRNYPYIKYLGATLFEDSLHLRKQYENKIIFIGNFENDKVQTPVGFLPGTIVIANTFLTLNSGRHIVNIWWLIIMLIAFTMLSYIAIFGKIPKLELKLRFIFSSQVVDFLNKYISYTGALFLITVISYTCFDMYVNVLSTGFIFSAIDFIKNRKYKS